MRLLCPRVLENLSRDVLSALEDGFNVSDWYASRLRNKAVEQLIIGHMFFLDAKNRSAALTAFFTPTKKQRIVEATSESIDI